MTDQSPRVTSVYRPHETTLIDIWDLGQVRYRVYTITSTGSIDPELLSTSRQRCADITDPQAHGAGWITIHQTSNVCYTFANWWCQQSIVRRRGWVSPGDRPAALRPIADDVTTCVWEIPIAAAERDAWVQFVMSPEPDIEGYLSPERSTTDTAS